MRYAVIAFACAAILPCSAHADVYRCTVEGKTVYTDQPCAGGKPADKLNLPQNAIGPVDLPEIRAKLEALDKRLAQRAAERRQQNAAMDAADRAHDDRCQGYRDNIDRQQPWLDSHSDAARKSAAAEIGIQQRRLVDNDCR